MTAAGEPQLCCQDRTCLVRNGGLQKDAIRRFCVPGPCPRGRSRLAAKAAPQWKERDRDMSGSRKGAAFVLVQPPHLPDFLRDVQLLRLKARAPGGQRRVLTDRHRFCGRRIQHDVAAPRLVCVNRPVKEPEDHVRLCAVIKQDLHPFAPLHAEGRSQIGRRSLPEDLPAAFEVAPLDLYPSVEVPLAHELDQPLPRAWVRQDRRAGEVRPLASSMLARRRSARPSPPPRRGGRPWPGAQRPPSE